MKAYEILGYVYDGAMYCDDHKPEPRDGGDEEAAPVFAGDALPDDYCDTCLHDWITSTPALERAEGAPGWVYLFGERPNTSTEEG